MEIEPKNKEKAFTYSHFLEEYKKSIKEGSINSLDDLKTQLKSFFRETFSQNFQTSQVKK